MKRTFFDNIIVGILILLVAAFLGLATYMSYATQKVLVSEKQDSLVNEAMLLSEQTIGTYLRGFTPLENLQVRFDEFDDTLKTHIWFYGRDGMLITASNPTEYSNLPQNIRELEPQIDL